MVDSEQEVNVPPVKERLRRSLLYMMHMEYVSCCG